MVVLRGFWDTLDTGLDYVERGWAVAGTWAGGKACDILGGDASTCATVRENAARLSPPQLGIELYRAGINAARDDKGGGAAGRSSPATASYSLTDERSGSKNRFLSDTPLGGTSPRWVKPLIAVGAVAVAGAAIWAATRKGRR